MLLAASAVWTVWAEHAPALSLQCAMCPDGRYILRGLDMSVEPCRLLIPSVLLCANQREMQCLFPRASTPLSHVTLDDAGAVWSTLPARVTLSEAP